MPASARIATFDHDGTLWIEQPIYNQAAFVIDRIRAMAPRRPDGASTQPYKAVIEGDCATLATLGEKGLLELVMAARPGMTTDQFATDVTDWLATARRPRFDRPYGGLVYQTMVELLTHQRAYGFKINIVSGGGIEFRRPLTWAVHGMSSEQLVGSSIRTKFELRDGVPVTVKLPEVDFVDDKGGKPVGIQKFVGLRPIAAFGNSDSDLEMLQWRKMGVQGRRFGLIPHYDDAEHEYAYDRHSLVGRLDKALDAAPAAGWTVVSLKNDWREMFPSP